MSGTKPPPKTPDFGHSESTPDSRQHGVSRSHSVPQTSSFDEMGVGGDAFTRATSPERPLERIFGDGNCSSDVRAIPVTKDAF